MMKKLLTCSVCDGKSLPLGVVDFNKSCEEKKGKFLPRAGIPIPYYLCTNCGFCFAPEFMEWELDHFLEKIYNEQYVIVDPDCKENRPKANATSIVHLFNKHKEVITHLDFGGGNGLLRNRNLIK